MAAIDLKSLVGKLNAPCRRALEGAAGLTLSRSQFNVEIEHWLVKLLEDERSDVAACLRHYEIAVGRVAAELARALDRLKTGNAHPPALSPSLVTLGREAWLLATLEYGDGQIRSGHLLVALLSDETLGQHARAASPSLARIPPDELRRRLTAITAASAETAETTVRTDSAGPGPVAAGRTEALDRYTIDLTERARAGRLDPVLGRDGEIRQVIDILTRRRQNNPILTGEAGVGKTAVVEGFALRIAAGDVPEDLRNVSLRTLDLGLLQAGAGVKGEFENRLKSVIEEVQASPRPIILFIDEAHTLIGAGGQAGQGDAANLLKPALARGELRTVAATTWSEYKKYFEKDAALTRRFQVVKVDEPGEAAAIDMMRGVVPMLEAHHGVRILDEAVEDCVRLSHRYVAGRQLPDKSMSLLDTACARVAMAHAATPEAIEERRRRIERLEAEIAILRREEATGGETGRIADLQALRDQAGAEHEALRARWEQERGLVDRIRGLRDRIEAAEGLGPAADEAESPSEDVAALRAEYAETRRALAEMQGEAPLIPVEVDAQAVAEVVANWTGIPVGRMVSDEIRSILALEDRLRERVVGQNHALEVTARAIRTARAKLTDPRKPIGVFLFLGPSGVGKTETALALADLLYGGEQNLTVINMSEFKEEHKVSLLLGSPPGYVGYGEGGVLTEAVRRRPYSVVLLDELEKAHPGVQDVFYQVFDKGMLRDGEGRDIDFKNTVIILTSNVGTDLIAKLCADPDTAPAPADLAAALRPELLKTFKPAFLGRLSVIPFLPLDDDTMRSIARLQLERIRRRIEESYGARFSYDDSLVDELRARATENESGARAIEQILANTLLPELAAEFLAHMADSHPVRDASVSVDSHGTIQYRVS
ncbi:type VI secretion system ATPase TssH [Mycobacterium sp. KBS0706]|uniref:type VI secretion system ATPase TssH n=1 Tax=Mycobacterium sp. KBS0706 TaxID=2578109 RepID=UPI00110FC8EE|nr:type VI secretion system ATPase TssH [Mycobacterium sp. KBS0706]TSD89822.1 type VI secretion system ATPase TssH [Mycobacterium sp. KBS0706]